MNFITLLIILPDTQVYLYFSIRFNWCINPNVSISLLLACIWSLCIPHTESHQHG